ncbi:unnamed protein product [Lactuca virosa]|uniref:Uncharacterized protein n=1 Tax=Lactuca virosa TaxID=75947 RepID=A0AAU9LWL8_9ASTR|nr:unnamed protein product [Lactuca virosa]
MKVNDVKGKDDQKKKSYAKAVMGEETSKNISDPQLRKVMMGDRELTGMTDAQSTILCEVREASFIPNLVNMRSEEGFPNVRIRYVGGLWVWVSFESSKACKTFYMNTDYDNQDEERSIDENVNGNCEKEQFVSGEKVGLFNEKELNEQENYPINKSNTGGVNICQEQVDSIHFEPIIANANEKMTPGAKVHTESNDERSETGGSKPPGFGGQRFQEQKTMDCRGSFLYSGNEIKRSLSTGSVKILEKKIPIAGVSSCDEVSRFIELGKLWGYDVENAKADLKKRLVGMGVIQSL